MILADTHAVLWLTLDADRLSSDADALLLEAKRSGELAISAFTLLELAQAVARGKVVVNGTLESYLQFVESIFLILPITGAIAIRATRFSRQYPGDPGDRLIGATAVVHGAKLVTKNRLILASGEVDCIW